MGQSGEAALRKAMQSAESLWTDPRRLRAMLSDLLPQDGRAIHLLVVAAEDGIPAQLLRSSGTATQAMTHRRCIDQLMEHRGLQRDFAQWAVTCWSAALGDQTRADEGPLRPRLLAGSSLRDGHWEVFVADDSGAVWHRWWHGTADVFKDLGLAEWIEEGWSDWNRMTDTDEPSVALAAGSHDKDHQEMLAITTTGRIQHRWGWPGGWSEWHTMSQPR